MTAEICIMNTSGVALAADSAVTIGGVQKIYTSAEKLFQLSLHAPVGLMIYGNAQFLDIPWETIVKTYRRSLKDSPFRTVQEYGESFITFLKSSPQMFPKELQKERIILLLYIWYLDLIEEVKVELDLEAEKHGGLNVENVTKVVEKVITSNLDQVKKRDLLTGFDKRHITRLKKALGSRVNEIKSQLFGTLPLNTASQKALNSLTYEIIVRNTFGPLHSGVVIAGFGEEQFMPAMINYTLEEMILDLPRVVKTRESLISSVNSSSVTPFAQKDMVYAFMEGIQLDLWDFIQESTQNLFTGTIEIIINEISKVDAQIGKHIKSKLDKNLEKMLQDLFDEWGKSKQRYWSPVLEVIAALPKDQLGEMAESFVNLTKFRRQITAVPETVGGPIDVAVITKGDGFIWKKRKHYFDPTLNPRAIARFQKGE